jgi:hypothetical protein
MPLRSATMNPQARSAKLPIDSGIGIAVCAGRRIEAIERRRVDVDPVQRLVARRPDRALAEARLDCRGRSETATPSDAPLSPTATARARAPWRAIPGARLTMNAMSEPMAIHE